MMDTSFFDQVRKHFRYLVDEFGFSIAREEKFPHFDFAEVVLQSKDCQIRLSREKGDVFLHISPLLPSQYWISLGTVIAYLSQETDNSWKYWENRPGNLDNYDSRIEWELGQLAQVLRPYVAQICALFRRESFEQKKAELIAMAHKLAEEWWEQYIVEK